MIDLKDKTWLEWLEEKDHFSAGYLSCDSEHPEQYEGLVVRVGGFSGYFRNLSPAQQDDVIARTEHSI